VENLVLFAGNSSYMCAVYLFPCSTDKSFLNMFNIFTVFFDAIGDGLLKCWVFFLMFNNFINTNLRKIQGEI